MGWTVIDWWGTYWWEAHHLLKDRKHFYSCWIQRSQMEPVHSGNLYTLKSKSISNYGCLVVQRAAFTNITFNCIALTEYVFKAFSSRALSTWVHPRSFWLTALKRQTSSMRCLTANDAWVKQDHEVKRGACGATATVLRKATRKRSALKVPKSTVATIDLEWKTFRTTSRTSRL